ncbi:hypothetical protein TRAPUB_6946 [Trametes pubescens]|uniref:Uncharacterized protein n=1 Tax=Trametes pubescens TaxID=154538 RepID=A0A1M2V4H6_TRAPU|nr:hypothetical protein TRAPUB_6946 [Trametes pubescens]
MLASNKKTTDGIPRDRSKANTEYTVGGNYLSEIGTARSSFEHQRVFYRLCQSTIERPIDYALNLAPWFKSVRMFSFAFNTWTLDVRSLPEREEAPVVLDVGWTEFVAPNDSADLTALSTSHYVIEETKNMGNRQMNKLSLPNITQIMPRATIAALLQDVFAPSREGAPKSPMILLVHDAKMTRCVLRCFDVDSSQWRAGIKDLLYYPDARVTPRQTSYHESKRDVRDYSGKWKRERSRSPRRSGAVDYPPRPRSPPQTHAPPSVYLVDVRQMYQNLMQVPKNESITSYASEFALRDTAPGRGEDDTIIYEDIDPESWLIGYVWEEMANSIAIDEQRASRKLFSKEELIEVYPGAPGGAGGDDDVDPNDIVQPGAQPGNPTSAPKPVGMYDSASEDDDW